MSVIEAIWVDVLLVVTTWTFWAMVVVALFVCLALARFMTLRRIEQGEEPVRAAVVMLTVSAIVMYVPFAAMAYVFDSWSSGTFVGGAAFVIVVPIVLALALGKAVEEENLA